jgi:hypothetical protein
MTCIGCVATVHKLLWESFRGIGRRRSREEARGRQHWGVPVGGDAQVFDEDAIVTRRGPATGRAGRDDEIGLLGSWNGGRRRRRCADSTRSQDAPHGSVVISKFGRAPESQPPGMVQEHHPSAPSEKRSPWPRRTPGGITRPRRNPRRPSRPCAEAGCNPPDGRDESVRYASFALARARPPSCCHRDDMRLLRSQGRDGLRAVPGVSRQT